jgi:antitoxin component HigA of HigAB toxin-antitoxin module
MAKKMIRPIHSEADYEAALNEIERYFESEPKPGTPEADRFDLLALIIEDYERKRWPIEPPDTIDAIRYRMETGPQSLRGVKRRSNRALNLRPWIASRSLSSGRPSAGPVGSQ